MIRRLIALFRKPSPVMLIPVDLDCDALVHHALINGQWTPARYSNSPTAQYETRIFDQDLDIAVHSAIKQALDVYVKHFPALQVTRDEAYRVMRYHEGQEFPLHVDQNSMELQATRVMSVIIYLNDDFDGGHTVFPDQGIDVKPRKGQCLFLPACYAFPHASTPIKSGVKYVVVTHLHIGPPWMVEE